MINAEIKRIAKSLQPQLWEQLQKSIAIPSVKGEAEPNMPFGKGVADCLNRTLQLCEQMGMRTKNAQGYVGWAEVGQGEEMLGILAHLDVVPEGRDWDYPPFAGEIHDGKLYGRGAIDDKGPALAAIYALKTVMESGVKLNKRVRLIFGGDEESDWEDMNYYVAHEEHPTLGFTPDADFPVIFGEKGILNLELRFDAPFATAEKQQIFGGSAPNVVPDSCDAVIKMVDGELFAFHSQGESTHASTPELGQNAISKMMENLYLQKQQGKISEDHPYGKFLDFYHETIGMDYSGAKMKCALQDEESGKLTFNVGKISTENEEIKMTIDIRYPVTFSQEEIVKPVKEEVSKWGGRTEVVGNLPPIYAKQDSLLTKALLKVYREITGDDTEPLTMGGGTYARAMSNIVAFGPLFPGQVDHAHQKNEFITLEDLERITEIYALAIIELAQ